MDFPGHLPVKAGKHQAASSLGLRIFTAPYSCLHFLLLTPFLLFHCPLKSPMGPCQASNSSQKHRSLQVKILPSCTVTQPKGCYSEEGEARVMGEGSYSLSLRMLPQGEGQGLTSI